MDAQFPKDQVKFYCECCDIKTNNKKDYTKHLLTPKHKKNDEKMQNDSENSSLHDSFACSCGKSYKYRQGLQKHKKNCDQKMCKNEKMLEQSDHETDEKHISEFKMLAELFKLQMNENKELKELIIEQNKQMMELAKEGKNITNNTNNTTNNNHFNLQFFLNEQCKDALNIMDFVNTIKLQISDLDMIGRLGYTEGMSKIFIRNLKELDIFKRPNHSSDLKRETLYVKDKDAWEKENDENFKIKQAIKGIENKNIKQLPQWRAENPTAEDTDTKKHLDYQHILCESMGGSTLEDDNKKHEKIVRNIAKEVVIDKNPAK